MRIAFSKPTRDEAELAQLMTGFRAAGYEGLQLKMGQYLPYVGRADEFRARWGDDTGSVSALIVFDTLEPDGVQRLEAAIRFAAEVGSGLIVYCHNHTRTGVTRADREDFARQLAGLASRAAEHGIRFSLHHHYDQPVMLPEDVREFFGALDPGTIGLTVDTGHLAMSGVTDIPGFLAEFSPIIDNIHLKDMDGNEWRVVGEGALDLPAVVDQLRRQGYGGWLCIDEESSATVKHGLTASRAWLDAHLTPA